MGMLCAIKSEGEPKNMMPGLMDRDIPAICPAPALTGNYHQGAASARATTRAHRKDVVRQQRRHDDKHDRKTRQTEPNGAGRQRCRRSSSQKPPERRDEGWLRNRHRQCPAATVC